MNAEDFDRAQKLLQPFAKKNIPFAVKELLLTLIMVWGSIVLSYYSFIVGQGWVLFISVPITTAFMCRSYVIEHDCGHQSFFRQGKWNDIAGNLVGFGIMIPYSMWKFVHHSHHMNVGNLDRRNFNPEIWTLTIEEYQKASQIKKNIYRMMRSRFVRLFITPTLNYFIGCRLFHPNFSKKAIVSVLVHNVIYTVILWFVISYIGLSITLIIFFLPLVLFFGIAAYTFYGQHQFEETYWRNADEWNWKEATSHGATDLQAPKWFCWLIGNVVYHTAHHIYFTVPFYRLHEAQKVLDKEFNFKKISISQVWQLMGLKLWDQDKQRLVSFKDALSKS